MISELDQYRSAIRYEPDTGRLFRKFKGKPERALASVLSSTGYGTFILFGKRVLAHRVAWFVHFGDWPVFIDHINGDRSDNRLANLRNVSRTGNQRNQALNKNNKSGVPGVRWIPRIQRWRAEIGCGPKRKHLGNFLSFDEARKARKAAEPIFGYHPNHGRSAA